MSKPIEQSPTGGSETAQRAQLTVLVGIPAYNEAGSIHEVVTEAQKHADDVVVVDDGSDDQTAQLARAAGARVISHPENLGYGATLRTLFEDADERGADHLVILDGDGQHTVSDVPTLVKTQQETGAELVSGSRFSGEAASKIPLYRRFGLAVINLLTNLSLRIGYAYEPVSDSQCGFRVYSSEAIELIAASDELDSGMGASLDILFQAARHEFDIVEVPTRIDYEVDDASTKNPALHGLSLLRSLFVSVFRDRPLRFGSALAVILLAPLVSLAALIRTGATAVSVVITILLTLIFVIWITLLGTVSRRSGRTNQ